MNNKHCFNCKWWDTFSIPNCCGLSIKQNNPAGFKNSKYQRKNRKDYFCDEWKMSPFNLF